jgi:hypothetical protein
MDTGLAGIPVVTVSHADRLALARGQVVRAPAGITATPSAAGQAVGAGVHVIRVVDDAGRLVAMAQLRAGRLYPDKVFVSPGPADVTPADVPGADDSGADARLNTQADEA